MHAALYQAAAPCAPMDVTLGCLQYVMGLGLCPVMAIRRGKNWQQSHPPDLHCNLEMPQMSLVQAGLVAQPRLARHMFGKMSARRTDSYQCTLLFCTWAVPRMHERDTNRLVFGFRLDFLKTPMRASSKAALTSSLLYARTSELTGALRCTVAPG